MDDRFTLPKSLLIQTPILKPLAPPALAESVDGSGSIPLFYHPRKRVPNPEGLEADELAAIDKLFTPLGGGPLRTFKDYHELTDFTTTTLGLSRFFTEQLFKRIQKVAAHGSALTRDDMVAFWKGRLLLSDSVSNFFHLVKQDANDYITRADFREYLWVLLDTHPGLAFLRDSPEFQDRYADTVICRIFYHTDHRKVNKIYLRDLRRATNPSIVRSWLDLDATEDINSVRQFFSYEHFYVLYCKFWDLDSDHDFLIDKEDLIKYDGHAWNPRGIDRVFAQVGMKFTSGIPNKMAYDDFVWFILSDEDKTSDVSLEFFFALIDLDGDGVIRDHEMRHFYEDQVQRLECINQEAPNFADIMCQMNDLLRPEREGQFRIAEFRRRRKQHAGVFFSILLSLNKFMLYEQRDPFQQKQEQINNPDFTDWDRFCLGEYVRLAMEAGGDGSSNNQNNGGHADGGGATDEFLRNPDGILR